MPHELRETAPRDRHRERPDDVESRPTAILGRIDHVAKQVHAARRRMLVAVGGDVWEYEVLATLRRAGPDGELSPRELRAALLVSGGAVTNRIDHLERAGLVERCPDATDRRAVRVRLTEPGRVWADRLVDVSLHGEDALLGSLDARERRLLARLLGKVLDALEPTRR